MDKITSKSESIYLHWLTISIILLIGISGSLMIFYATTWGPWVLSDSTEYIVAARNLIAGRGLGLYGPSGAFHPSVLHPPFYSLVLSAFGLLHLDIVSVARWLDILLFGLTIFLTGISIYAFTKSAWLSIISSFLLLSMPTMVDGFSGAMSEPLYLFTGLACISLAVLFTRDNRIIFLVAAAVAAGMAMLTRYDGLAFVLVGGLILLTLSQGPWKKKVLYITIFGSISILPTVVWIIWVRSQSQVIRTLSFSANILERFAQFRVQVMKIVWSWQPLSSLLPAYSYNRARDLSLIIGALVLLVFILSIIKLRNSGRILNPANGFALGVILITMSIVSILTLGFSYFFTYPSPDIANRILLLERISILLAVFSLLYMLIKSWRMTRWSYIIPVLLFLVIIIPNLKESLKIASVYHLNGAGYTSKKSRDSETIRMINTLPPSTPLISNESAYILFYTNRLPYDISEIVDSTPQDLTAQYGTDLSDPPQKAFRQSGAALVLFDSSFWQFEKLYGAEAAYRLESLTRGLSVYSRSEDGTIYFYPPGQ